MTKTHRHPGFIKATKDKSCENCAAIEGAHYCLLWTVGIKNADVKRCKDWTPAPTLT